MNKITEIDCLTNLENLNLLTPYMIFGPLFLSYSLILFFKAIETGTGDFCSSSYLGMSNKIKLTVADLSKHNQGNGNRGFVYDSYELIRERGGHRFYLMR